MLSPCPDEQDFLDFSVGGMRAARLAAFEEHLAACADCALLLVELALQRPVTDDAAPPEDSPRARMVGRYTLQKILGAGGMGVVWQGSDPALARAVAIKMLRPELGADEGSRARRAARLMDEARALASLNHPNILTIYDVGEDDGQVWLACELLEGPTLRAWSAARPWREALAQLMVVGEALEAAHSAGIVHGDVKPDNAILRESGAAVLTDFGLASRDGVAGQVGGTAAYMAPELVAGGQPTPRTDQYAFCVMASALLVGAPRGLMRALRRGMRADPARRFETMGALLAAMRLATSRRHAAPLIAALAGVALLSAALITQRPPAPALAPQAPPPPVVVMPPPAVRPDVETALAPASWALHLALRTSRDHAMATKPASRRRVGATPVRASAPDAPPLRDEELLKRIYNDYMRACEPRTGTETRCRRALAGLDEALDQAGGALAYVEAQRGDAGRYEEAKQLVPTMFGLGGMFFARHGRCEEARRRHHQSLILSSQLVDRPNIGHNKLIHDASQRDHIFRQLYPNCADAAPAQPGAQTTSRR
jgi:hypothetical protein